MAMGTCMVMDMLTGHAWSVEHSEKQSFRYRITTPPECDEMRTSCIGWLPCFGANRCRLRAEELRQDSPCAKIDTKHQPAGKERGMHQISQKIFTGGLRSLSNSRNLSISAIIHLRSSVGASLQTARPNASMASSIVLNWDLAGRGELGGSI